MKTNWVDTFASFLVVEKCFWKIRKNIAKYYSCWKTKKKIIFTENCYYVTVCKNEKFTPFTWERMSSLEKYFVKTSLSSNNFFRCFHEIFFKWVRRVVKMVSESNFLAIFFVKSITNVFHFTENIVPLNYCWPSEARPTKCTLAPPLHSPRGYLAPLFLSTH